MESDGDILIERLNTDKTRRDIGSDMVHHVYFELSGHPAPEWISIFRICRFKKSRRRNCRQ